MVGFGEEVREREWVRPGVEVGEREWMRNGAAVGSYRS